MQSGHPWLYRTHLTPEFHVPEKAAYVKFADDWWAWSPTSEIRLRRLGPWSRAVTCPVTVVDDPATFETHFGPALEKHLASVFERKSKWVDGDPCFRWIFSEVDGLPGLVVDRFGSSAVAQIQTAPVERVAWPALEPRLKRALAKAGVDQPQVVPIRSSPTRRKEGLEVEARAESAASTWMRWNGLEWLMTAGGSQKTGSYLDQRDNHTATAAWAKRLGLKSAWDLCCHEGGFGLHLAKAGLDVTFLDQSITALETVRENLKRNGLEPDRHTFFEANVFDWLKASHRDGRKVDLVVLDPPSFVRARSEKEGALRGLKELNLRALHALKPGGLLVTCTCSHHIGPNDLEAVLGSAAVDARRTFRILETRGPAPDHAPLGAFPESNYLQTWIVEVS